MIKDNNYESLPEYLETVECRYNILQEYKFDLATDHLRDNFMVELLS